MPRGDRDICDSVGCGEPVNDLGLTCDEHAYKPACAHDWRLFTVPGSAVIWYCTRCRTCHDATADVYMVGAYGT